MSKSEKELLERDRNRDIGAELLQSIREMKADKRARATEVSVSWIIKIRHKTGLSQSGFSELLGVSVRTLQDWEQGRRQPSGPAVSLLRIADKYPEVFIELAAQLKEAFAELLAYEIAGQARNDKCVWAYSVRLHLSLPFRLLDLAKLQLPEDAQLKEAAYQTGLLGSNMIGITLGYAIYLNYSHKSIRLLSHEFRHVYQYEQAGSIGSFLATYLQQIAQHGYYSAPLEVGARANELKE